MQLGTVRRAGAPWRSFDQIFLARRSLSSSTPFPSMSGPDGLNLSLPSKPVPSLASYISSSSNLGPSLPSRPAFALPARPIAPPATASFLPSTKPRGIRDTSPPPLRERDVYRPISLSPPQRSPPPRVREYTDTWVPSPSPSTPRRYRSPTPPPRRRSPSPPRRHYSRSSRSPNKRRLYLSASPSPRKRRQSPSTSFSPSKHHHSPSPSRSDSRDRPLTPPLDRTTFYTRSHKRALELEEKRRLREEAQESREKLRREKQLAREAREKIKREREERARKEEEDQWVAYKDKRKDLDQEL